MLHPDQLLAPAPALGHAPPPAFAGDLAVPPSDADVLDWMARALELVDPDEALASEAPGTVAVVPELMDCDACRAHVARFDTVIPTRRHPDGVRVFACVPCTRARGPQHLGHGGSTYLLQHDEVSRAVRELLRRAGAGDLWDESDADAPWRAAYRALGFGGPTEAGEMVRELGGRSIRATPEGGAISVSFTRTYPETTWTGSQRWVVPADWSAEEVQHMLRHELSHLRRPAWPSVLEVTLADAEQRVRQMLDSGAMYVDLTTGEFEKRPGLRLELWSGSALMREDVLRVARRSEDADLLRLVVDRHPDEQAVLESLANPACPPDVVARVAREQLSSRTAAVLRRPDLPEEDVVALAEVAVRARTRSQQGLVSAIAVHRHCPAELALVLADRLDPDHRGHAVAMAAGLPAERRRDLVDTFLDERRRTIVTNDVVDAAVGLLAPDADDRPLDLDEVGRLTSHPQYRARQHALGRLTDLGIIGDPDDEEGAPPGRWVAVRLRRWWGDEAVGWLTSGGYADVEQVRRSELTRYGSELVIGTPATVDLRTFFADGLGSALEEGLAKATDGYVTRLSHQHVDATTRRRQGSRPTDVYSPGDPVDERLEAAIDLRGTRYLELGPALDEAARRALALVSVAGVSRHRLWLAVPDKTSAERLWRTPGAAAYLHRAVTRWQGAQPLYSVVVDERLARSSPPVVAPDEPS